MFKTLKNKGLYFIVAIVCVIVGIFVMNKFVPAYQAFQLLDLENKDISYGIKYQELKTLKGEPDKVKYNIGDTPTNEYLYFGKYMNKSAKISYFVNGKLNGYTVIIEDLTVGEGRELFDYTASLCNKRVKNSWNPERKITKAKNNMVGVINVPCAKYGIQLDMKQTKDVEWSYRKGMFKLQVSNPVDAIL